MKSTYDSPLCQYRRLVCKPGDKLFRAHSLISDYMMRTPDADDAIDEAEELINQLRNEISFGALGPTCAIAHGWRRLYRREQDRTAELRLEIGRLLSVLHEAHQDAQRIVCDLQKELNP